MQSMQSRHSGNLMECIRYSHQMTNLTHGLGTDWVLGLPSPTARTDALELIGSILCLRFAHGADQQCEVRKVELIISVVAQYPPMSKICRSPGPYIGSVSKKMV